MAASIARVQVSDPSWGRAKAGSVSLRALTQDVGLAPATVHAVWAAAAQAGDPPVWDGGDADVAAAVEAAAVGPVATVPLVALAHMLADERVADCRTTADGAFGDDLWRQLVGGGGSVYAVQRDDGSVVVASPTKNTLLFSALQRHPGVAAVERARTAALQRASAAAAGGGAPRGLADTLAASPAADPLLTLTAVTWLGAPSRGAATGNGSTATDAHPPGVTGWWRAVCEPWLEDLLCVRDLPPHLWWRAWALSRLLHAVAVPVLHTGQATDAVMQRRVQVAGITLQVAACRGGTAGVSTSVEDCAAAVWDAALAVATACPASAGRARLLHHYAHDGAALLRDPLLITAVALPAAMAGMLADEERDTALPSAVRRLCTLCGNALFTSRWEADARVPVVELRRMMRRQAGEIATGVFRPSRPASTDAIGLVRLLALHCPDIANPRELPGVPPPTAGAMTHVDRAAHARLHARWHGCVPGACRDEARLATLCLAAPLAWREGVEPAPSGELHAEQWPLDAADAAVVDAELDKLAAAGCIVEVPAGWPRANLPLHVAYKQSVSLTPEETAAVATGDAAAIVACARHAAAEVFSDYRQRLRRASGKLSAAAAMNALRDARLARTSKPKARLVVDGRVLNEALCTDRLSFTLPAPADLFNDVQEGDWLISCDVKSGFLHCLYDSVAQRYVCARPPSPAWAGRTVSWRRVAFGVGCSPITFVALTASLTHALRALGVRVVCCFVDDFTIAARTREAALQARAVVEAVCQQLGVALSPDKWAGPTQRLEQLGLEVHTCPPRLAVSSSKVFQYTYLAALLYLIATTADLPAAARFQAPPELCNKVAGKLGWASGAVVGARPVMAPLWHLMERAQRVGGRSVDVSGLAGLQSSLHWWLAAASWRPCLTVAPRALSLAAASGGTAQSDADPQRGLGCMSGRTAVFARFREGYPASSTVAELYAVLVAVISFGTAGTGATVLRTDSLAAAHAINRGTSDVEAARRYIRAIYYVCSQLGTEVLAVQTPRQDLRLVDAISHSPTISAALSTVSLLPSSCRVEGLRIVDAPRFVVAHDGRVTVLHRCDASCPDGGHADAEPHPIGATGAAGGAGGDGAGT